MGSGNRMQRPNRMEKRNGLSAICLTKKGNRSNPGLRNDDGQTNRGSGAGRGASGCLASKIYRERNCGPIHSRGISVLLSSLRVIPSPAGTPAGVGDGGVGSALSDSSDPYNCTQSPSLIKPFTLSLASSPSTTTASTLDAISSITCCVRSQLYTVPFEEVIVASLTLSACMARNSWSSLRLLASSNLPKFVRLVTSSNFYCLPTCTSTLLFPQLVYGLYFMLCPLVAILTSFSFRILNYVCFI